MGRHHWAGKGVLTQGLNSWLQDRHPPLGRSCCVSALGAASGCVPVLRVSGSCLPVRLHRPPLPTWSVTLSVCLLCAAECTRPPALPFPALQRLQSRAGSQPVSPAWGLIRSVSLSDDTFALLFCWARLIPALDKFSVRCTGCSPPLSFCWRSQHSSARKPRVPPALCTLSVWGCWRSSKARARGQNTPISASPSHGLLPVPVSLFPFL